MQSLPDIERATRFVARRQGLSAGEAEDFGSEVKLALIRNDYQVLARFEGRSSLKTYLVVVIQRLFLDHRRKQWGKWRASAQARRLGEMATRLEVLLYRDHLSLAEAVEVLGREGISCAASQLSEIVQRLPVRQPRAREDVALDDNDAATGPAHDPHAQLHSNVTASRCQSVLTQALRELPPDDRLILRMRFEDDVSVAAISRALSLDQKQLYRRMEYILAKVRAMLEKDGIEWPEVAQMLENGHCHLRLPLAEPENGGPGPSLKEAMG